MPAQIDDVVPCTVCDDKPGTTYIIFSPLVLPGKTRKWKCAQPENLFYKVTEHTDETQTIVLVCKIGRKYIKVAEDDKGE